MTEPMITPSELVQTLEGQPPKVALITPPQRLSKVLKEGGGVSIRSAMLDAKREIGMLKGDILKELDKRLAVVTATYETLGDAPAPEAIQELYDATNKMVGLGIHAGRPHFDTAAMCLCILLDKMIRFAGYDSQTVRVHVAAFPLMVRADPAGADSIIQGLGQLGAQRRFQEPEIPDEEETAA